MVFILIALGLYYLFLANFSIGVHETIILLASFGVYIGVVVL